MKKNMLNVPLMCMLIALLCAGCDTAAKQQQAEQARRAATVEKLKQLGEDLHNKADADSLPNQSAGEAP